MGEQASLPCHWLQASLLDRVLTMMQNQRTPANPVVTRIGTLWMMDGWDVLLVAHGREIQTRPVTRRICGGVDGSARAVAGRPGSAPTAAPCLATTPAICTHYTHTHTHVCVCGLWHVRVRDRSPLPVRPIIIQRCHRTPTRPRRPWPLLYKASSLTPRHHAHTHKLSSRSTASIR